jgi:hypothetical protein
MLPPEKSFLEKGWNNAEQSCGDSMGTKSDFSRINVIPSAKLSPAHYKHQIS